MEYFQDGRRCGHLGYRNKMILAILNHHVASLPLTKFWAQSDVPPSIMFRLNPTYGLGGDVV